MDKGRDWVPNKTTKRAMEESREILKRGAQFETAEEMFESLHARDVIPVISMHANGKSLKLDYASSEIDIEGKSNDEILIEYINKLKEDVEDWEGYERVKTELTFFVEANKVFPNIFSVKWEYL